jgi:hypothetical protein
MGKENFGTSAWKSGPYVAHTGRAKSVNSSVMRGISWLLCMEKNRFALFVVLNEARRLWQKGCSLLGAGIGLMWPPQSG